MTLTRQLAVVWAIAGFAGLLTFALWRLGGRAAEAFAEPLAAQHWLLLAVAVVFMAYSEGYRGFQQKFSPRFAGRVVTLRDHGQPGHCLLAPFYAMGYFAAPRKVVITAWLLSLMIVVLVLTLRLVPQPWRGIADAGVVVGLGWGLVVTLIQTSQALRRTLPSTRPAAST